MFQVILALHGKIVLCAGSPGQQRRIDQQGGGQLVDLGRGRADTAGSRRVVVLSAATTTSSRLSSLRSRRQ